MRCQRTQQTVTALRKMAVPFNPILFRKAKNHVLQINAFPPAKRVNKTVKCQIYLNTEEFMSEF